MFLLGSLSIDSDGYPSADKMNFLNAYVKEHDLDFDAANKFMREDFVRLAEELPYAHVHVEEFQPDGGPTETCVCFSTGGWSGCEEFIYAVLRWTAFKMQFHYSWQRGGHYEFRYTKGKS